MNAADMALIKACCEAMGFRCYASHRNWLGENRIGR